MSEPDIKDQIKSIEYSDIFSDLQKQIRAVKVWKIIFRIRKWKMENRKLSCDGPQAHHTSASCATSGPVMVDSSSLANETE